MPTTSLPIPMNGFTDSANHQHGADGFTTAALNIFPDDNWEHRKRVGVRQGYQAVADMGADNDENVQLLLTYEVYRNASLRSEVLIVAGGGTVYASAAGTTFDVAYKTDGADASVVFTGVPVADELITLISTDESTDTYTAKAAEALASQEFNRTSANAIATFTFGETEFDDTTTATTIQLIDGEGSPLTRTYTLITGATSGTSFQRKATANLTAAEFKTVVEGSNGHNGTILVITNSTDGKVTLVQKTGDTAGNTTITDGAGWLTICSVNPPSAFAGGAASASNITVADSLQRCIEYNTNNVLYEKITVANDGAGTLTLTQAVAGLDGHTAIVEDMTNATKTDFANTGVHADDVIQSYDDVRGVQMGNDLFLVNGRYYYKIDMSATTPEITTWYNTTGATGLPEDTGGGKCTIITRFGGRIVMSGLQTSRTNWFMSRIGNAYDWTYAPDDKSGAQAGGTSTSFGKLGEPISAMFPFGDSGLMMAGPNTLTYLTADPVISGAQFIRMSNSVGVISPDSWCQGPEKTCYIVNTDGVYMIQPNSFNIQRGTGVSTGRLDHFFATVPDSDVDIRLAFDPSRQAVLMFVNRESDPVGLMHYQYHIPTASWWQVKSNDPRLDVMKTYCNYRAYAGEQVGLWLGMKSGRIATQPTTGVVAVDGSAHADPLKAAGDNAPIVSDGYAFSSKLAWAPINAGLSNQRLLMTELCVLMDTHDFPTPANVGNVAILGPRLYLYGADQAQVVADVSDEILLTESRTVIDGGVATTQSSPTYETAIDGGNGTDVTYENYSRRGTMTLTYTTGTGSLNARTVIIEDSTATTHTVTFDASVSASASTHSIAGIQGSTEGGAVLNALKLSLDAANLLGLIGVTCEEPTSTTMRMFMDDEADTDAPDLTGTAESAGWLAAAIDAGDHDSFINGGLAKLTGTYSLVDDSVPSVQREYSYGGYRIKRCGTTAPDQWLGFWGMFEGTASLVPSYIANAKTSTIPESTWSSVEIYPDAAGATFTFGDTEWDDVADATLTIIDTVPTTKIYKIKASDAIASSQEFNDGDSATAAATNFCTLVNSSNGHNGTITATSVAGAVTLVQAVGGTAGNTTITASTSPSWNAICDVNPPSTFTGGAGYTRSTVTIDTDTEDAAKIELGNWDLVSGRNKRIRMRKRESDFSIEMRSTGTSWVLEDIAVNIEQGGMFRTVKV